MEHLYRRGIYRPNAQRLSISLAPLVAQRSLLFRVKADLSTKTSYGQLTPTEESPGLFFLSASTSASASSDSVDLRLTAGRSGASASARIISAALSVVSSVLSTASVYSQDSWNGDVSPFAPILAPIPTLSNPNLNIDNRRHAMAFSPSVQWEELSEEDSDVVKTPLQSSAPSTHLGGLVDVILPKEEGSASSIISLNGKSGFQSDTKAEVQLHSPDGSPSSEPKRKRKSRKLLKKTSVDELVAANPKRMSRHSKAFGKVMSRLSMQPSRTKTKVKLSRMTITHPHILSTDYRLPEFKVSPIRMSFITTNPASLKALSLAVVRGPEQVAYAPRTSSLLKNFELVERKPDKWKQKKAPPPPLNLPPPPTPFVFPAPAATRAIVRPPTPSQSGSKRRASTPPPSLPSNPNPAAKMGHMGHRRYKSSPAVAQFPFKGWDMESMPPLPDRPRPSSVDASSGGAADSSGGGSKVQSRGVDVRSRMKARSIAVVAAAAAAAHGFPVVRAISPSFPVGPHELL